MNGHYPPGGAPSRAELEQAFALTVTALRDASIPHLFMGGVASSSLGRPRSTDDIDVFVSPDDARRALDALADRGFDVEETFADWLYKAFHGPALVDVIFRSAGDAYLDEEMLAHSRQVEWSDLVVPVMGPEDLAVIKAVAAKEATPHHWYDALALIARCSFDWPYFVERARRTGPRRALSLLLYAESNDIAIPGDAVDTLFTHVHRHPETIGAP